MPEKLLMNAPDVHRLNGTATTKAWTLAYDVTLTLARGGGKNDPLVSPLASAN